MTDQSFEQGVPQDPIQSLDFPCQDAETSEIKLDISYKISQRNCKSNVIDGMCRVICESITESSNQQFPEAQTSTPIDKFLVECDGKDASGRYGAMITRFAADGSEFTKKSATEIIDKMNGQ